MHFKTMRQWKSTFILIKYVNSVGRFFLILQQEQGVDSHIPFPCLGIHTLDHILKAWKRLLILSKLFQY